MTNFEITVDPTFFTEKRKGKLGSDPIPPLVLDEDDLDWLIVPRKTFLFYVFRFIINNGKYFDFSALNSTFTLVDIGAVVLGNFSTKLDLRNTSRAADSSKFIGTLDNHKSKTGEAPASFRFMVQDVYLTLFENDETNNGNVSSSSETQTELIDFVAIDAKGIVEKTTLAIKDLSLACKFGSVSIQADQMIKVVDTFRSFKSSHPVNLNAEPTTPLIGSSSLAKLGTLIIRVVKEVELKVISAGIYNIPLNFFQKDSEPSITLATSAKDFSLDLRRLNSKNPAFRLFFSDDDTAHQAIFTCSSFMFGIDHMGVQEEIIYVPLITVISKTNIFSKTIQFVQQTTTELNDTILRANINITTPSVSLEPHHVGILLSSFLSPSMRGTHSMTQTTSSFQKLWPRAYIKFTIDEPAARVLVRKPQSLVSPIPNTKFSLSSELSGMVVINCSKLYCDFESSHIDVDGESNYNSQCSFQLSTFAIWYRSSQGLRFDVLTSETLFLQMSAAFNPFLSVSISGQWNSIKLLAIHSEVFYGFREVMYHIKNSRTKKSLPSSHPKAFFLRGVPSWLTSFKFDISSVAISLASDELENHFSTSRGIKLFISKLFVEYQSVVDSTPRKDNCDLELPPTDNRCLNFTMDGLTGRKILGTYDSDNQEIFIDIPNFSSSISTDRDSDGPLVQFIGILPSVSIDWDINLQYLISICISLVRNTLLISKSQSVPKPKNSKSTEVIAINIKSNSIKVKATLPDDQKLMFDVRGLTLSASRDRFTNLYSRFLHVYALHPTVVNSWTKLITTRNLSVDFKNILTKLTQPNDLNPAEQILFSTDGCRINLAHSLVVYKLIDNFICAIKTSSILMHRAFENQSNYVLGIKERKTMPNIPKIRIKASTLFLTMEDDLFEAKLGLIFQIGLREQKKRLERELAFDAKLDSIKKGKKVRQEKEASEKLDTDKKHKKRRKSDFLKPPGDNGSINNAKSTSKTGDPGFKLRHTNTNKSFHHSIHAFHSHPRRAQTSMSHDVEYTILEDFNLSGDATVTVEEARYQLQKYFSENWIKEYNIAETNLKQSIQAQIDAHLGKSSTAPENLLQERIVDYSPFPFLFFMHISQVDWFISKPSFSESQLRDFLFDVGKGLPRDTRFSLLTPTYNRLTCASLRLQLRDYPLPLLYFPDLHSSQPHELPSIKIEGNFVIAETLSLIDSNVRKVFVAIDPLAVDHESEMLATNPFMLQVNRTVSSVKMYTDLKFDINTLDVSQITWCVSMQPAIQAFMQVFDLLSKPPIDPSEKLGFWDKIRSVFHARLELRWPEGNVHLQLNGSSNPYNLIGKDAGFVMCWKNNVELKVNGKDDPQELFAVTSDDFVLAIPDFRFQEREYLSRSVSKTGGLVCTTNLNDSTVFQKVIMKLSNRVRWVAGLLFERECMGDSPTGRTFNFKPHYEVILSNPASIKDRQNYDAYRGFRSDYLHLAVSVTSMAPDNWNDEAYMQNSYNSIHFTPKVFARFFQWWNLFDGSLSLPVRAGNLFNSGNVVRSKKFGRHLFSVKYQLQLAPVFLTHIYMQEKYANESKIPSHTCTGLKAKVGKIVMDLHQRRSPANSDSEAGMRWKMGLNVGEIDLVATDLRVLYASFKKKSENLAKSLGIYTSPGSSISNSNSGSTNTHFTTGKFHVSDNDYSWIDSDDFIEIGQNLPSRSNPKITILPFTYSPRFTYFRQTDVSSVEGHSVAPFGNEPSHSCLIGTDLADNTLEDLLTQRMVELEEQLKTNETMLESLQKDFQQFTSTSEVADRICKVQEDVVLLKERIAKIASFQDVNGGYKDNVQASMERSAREILMAMKYTSNAQFTNDESDRASCGSISSEDSLDDAGGSSFSNRFIVHSVQIKWNNVVRNSLLRYFHRVGERRSIAYFLTQRAVRYLDDLMEKQNKRSVDDDSSSDLLLSHEYLGDIFQGLKASSSRSNLKNLDNESFSLNDDLRATENENFIPEDRYLIKFISPQIQLISDQNPDYCVLLTSENIELKIVSIFDKLRGEDEGSSLVETRNGVSLQNAQFFVLSQEQVKSGAFTLFSNNSYGCGKTSMWPPWLSVDCCYDSRPLKDALTIDKTSVSLRYDRPNSLRMQAAKKAGSLKNVSAAMIRDSQHRQNRIAVDFPKVVATCDSRQFFATFTIVMDLLIYTEPMQKERSDRLDKVLLATDFSDLNNASRRVRQLQNEVRNFEDLKTEFMIRLSDLNSQALADLAMIEVEENHAVLELFVLMEAIKSGMQKVSNDEDTTELLKWTIGADQMILHVLDEYRNPFLDVGLANASFNRVEGSDGFNANSVEVGMMQGFNLVQDTFYPEMFSPYLPNEETYDMKSGNFISINWTMLDPIGGIPIIQQFDIDLKPIKLQIESKTWDMLFDYIFPKDAEGNREEESPFTGRYIKRTAGETSASSDTESFMSSSDEEGSHSILNSQQQSEIDSLSKEPRSYRKLISSSAASIISSSTGRSNDKSVKFSQHHEATPSTSSSSSKLKSDEHENDDLSLMIKRASNYLSIVKIRIFSSTLCVSYKGEGAHNILDIHELVLKLPDITYQNKTWSNMDLVLQMKKDVSKIVFNHTGALVSNKFRRHRKQKNTKPLSQLKDYVAFMSVSELVKMNSNESNGSSSVMSNLRGRRDTLVPKMSNTSSSNSHSSMFTHTRNGTIIAMENVTPVSSPKSSKDGEKEEGEKKNFLKRLF